MNAKNKDYFLLFMYSIIILLIFSLPILLINGVHQGDDLLFHLNRIASIVDSIKDKQFPLAIYPYSNYGFGYASPLFYCDLYLIIPSIIYYFGIFGGVINVYKLTLIFYSFIGIIIVSYTSYEVSNNKYISITSSIIWAFSSYHLTDAYYRSALGETIALSFMPLIVYASYRLFYLDDTSNKEMILLASSFDAVLFAHNISFLIAVLMFGAICLINIKKVISKKHLLLIFKAALLSIGLGSFFLFSMLEQLLDQSFIMKTSAVWLWEGIKLKDIFSDYMFVGRYDVYFIGITLIVLTIYSLLFIKKRNTFINSLIIVSILFSLLTLNVFGISKISTLGTIQYPFRFGIVPIVVLPFLFSFTNSKPKYLLCCLFAVLSLLNFYPTVNYLIGDDRYLSSKIENEELFKTVDDRLWSSVLGNGEYLPLTFDINYKENNGIIMYDNLDPCVFDYERSGSKILFNTSLDSEYNLLLPLTYYKGYQAYEIVDGKKIKIEIINNEYYHLIEIPVKEGNRSYCINYDGTILQKVSIIISLVAIFILYVGEKNERISKNI